MNSAKARRISTGCTRAFIPRCWPACGSKRLLAAHSDLYDQAYRYRRVMMSSMTAARSSCAAHQMLADRVIARDIPGSQAMLEAHLRSTLDFVYPPGSES